MKIYVLRAYVSVQNAILKTNSKSQLTAYVLLYDTTYTRVGLVLTSVVYFV